MSVPLTLDALLAAARAWAAQDPDVETRAELEQLIEDASAGVLPASQPAIVELHERFDDRLAFGTAGLRGELAAGPNRMNRVLVSQAAAGLAAYLRERRRDAASVVIGYDGRTNSEVFARDTAVLMAGAGVRAVLLPRLLPTPVLAYAVRRLGVSAGVMVTASHNPARDNGYKVYLGDDDAGSQIVPPADAEIAAHIARVAERPITELPRSDHYEIAGDDVVDAYIAAAADAAVPLPAPTPPLRWVYTPMHGVGWLTAARAFAAAGLPEPATVWQQLDPDPDFPTVAFPNPEEPGALDLAVARARETGAELIVANDPDADRLAVAIPDAAAEGGWRRLAGNEVGLLLGWAAAKEHRGDAGAALAASIVSSPGLRAIADHLGLRYVDTLTGFKWVSRVPGLVFGFEEALGYLVNPSDVRDKDGISAAARFVSLALEWKSQGLTVADCLERLAERIGAFQSSQISIRVTDLSTIGTIMGALRASPPAEIGGVAVASVEDLAPGSEALPPSDVLRIVLADGSRIMVRPSGTEPKLKAYLDAKAETLADAASRVAALDAAVRELLERLC